MSPSRLYSLVLLFGSAGIAWLTYFGLNPASHLSVCMIRSITGIPCPACGSTRSALAIISGQWTEALMVNPLGYIVILLLATCPVWVMYDILFGKKTFFTFYHKTENLLRKKPAALTLITIITTNWIWNICKGI